MSYIALRGTFNSQYLDEINIAIGKSGVVAASLDHCCNTWLI